MAFQMIHMEIAYRLLEQIPQIENAAEFILGSVAPDSVHMNPQFEIGMKVQSHMFEGCGEWSDTQDYVRWRRNIEDGLHKFDNKEKGTAYRDFTFGLCVHCLTDYWNDIKIWRKLQKEYIPPMELAEFREAYYPEARGIDFWLHQNGRNTKSIMEMLDKAVAFDIKGLVNKDDIEKLKHHLLNIQYNVDAVDISKYRFLSADFLEDFINFNVKDIEETLQQKMYASQHKG